MDLADLADLHIEAHIELALARHSRAHSGPLANAFCRRCDEEIPPTRRQLLPHVATCVDCAEKAELIAKTQYRRRPV
jgi:phage/conjugal plasmid C-4 type zinc finger TraR family protein